MANVLAELFQDIANAIRAKTGGSSYMKPIDFPERIEKIDVGSDLASITAKDNGVYYMSKSIELGKQYAFKNSYTKEELQALFNLGDTSISPYVSYIYKKGESYLDVMSVLSEYTLVWYVSPSEIYQYNYKDTSDQLLGTPAGWSRAKNGSSYIATRMPPSITFEEDGTMCIPDMSVLFNVYDCDGFDEVSVNIEKPALVSLTATANGTYRPQRVVELEKIYLMSLGYSQTELKMLYDLSKSKSADGMYACLYESPYTSNETVMLGIAYMNGFYGVYLSNGFAWLPEALASQMGSSEGWHQGADLTSMVKTDTIPTFDIRASGEAFVDDIQVMNSLFDLPEVNGFSEVTVNVEGVGAGGESANLVPLTVTKNGMYYPPTGNVEIGGTYTFKDSYTQEELQALYNLSTRLDEGDAFLFADDTASVALVVMSMGMMAVANGEEVSMYVGAEVASEIGLSEGWYENGETPTAMESPPTFTFLETGASYVDDITALNVLFDLPSAADGFSSVEVKVDRENDDTYTIHEFTFTAESKKQFVTWDIGQVPDITFMTGLGDYETGGIFMMAMYSRAMMNKFGNAVKGMFSYTLQLNTVNGLVDRINYFSLDYAAEESPSDSFFVNTLGFPRLATVEGFWIGSGTDGDDSKYGLKPGKQYRVQAITGIT